MNEKGFAATGILYTILVLFILLLLSIITMLYSRNNILNAIRNDVKGGIYNVVLNINGEEITERIKSDTIEFDIDEKDITGITNIVCNNGSTATYDEDNKTVTITNLKSGTVCKMNDSLKTTVDNLDYTKNNIIMISDETLTSEVTFAENTNAELNLNAHQLNTSKILVTNGDLVVKGDENSKIVSTTQVLNNSGTGKLTINGGTYERNSTSSGTVIYNQGTGTTIIKGGTYINSGSGACVQNRATTATDGGGTVTIEDGTFTSNDACITNNSISGILNINSGLITSLSGNAVRNYSSGTINIYQTDKPIYITSLSQTEKPVVVNSSTGVINISGNKADACENNSANTTSGLCVYAEGDKNYNNGNPVTANYAVSNHGNGTININGGTYFGGYAGISNHQSGIVNIKNADVIAGKLSISNLRIGTVNICNSNISWFSNTVASNHYHLWINSNTATTATINYSSNVIFTTADSSSGVVEFIDSTNTPSKGGMPANMIANYTGTCTE